MEQVFSQDGPHLGNQFLDDSLLKSALCRLLPTSALEEVTHDLTRFGWDVATDIKQLGQQAEKQPPMLSPTDAWGTPHSATLITSPAWRDLKDISAKEGLIAIAYSRDHGACSRIHQMAKLYLFGASSGLFNCPLAMTDGAARVCELYASSVPALSVAFTHLTSRDPATFWTSGQWMTERRGGSDVAYATETIAIPLVGNDIQSNSSSEAAKGPPWGATFRSLAAEKITTTKFERHHFTSYAGSAMKYKRDDDESHCDYRLYGNKWFSSAADGEMAMALAREVDATTRLPIAGARGLSLFYVPLKRPAPPPGCERSVQYAPEGVTLLNLKEKLGTRQLPTAELELRGVKAVKVSESGRGIAAISSAMVNITRLHNCAAAASYMRRMTNLAQDYCRRRSAFGRLLIDQPLAVATLARMEVHTSASLLLVLDVARLLGKQETGCATHHEQLLLRLLTPIAKAFTAKEAVAIASEGIEAIGGQGYIESTHIPVILRDAQVLTIWEGTTNVLSLDMIRVLGSKNDGRAAVDGFVKACRLCIEPASAANIHASKEQSGRHDGVPSVSKQQHHQGEDRGVCMLKDVAGDVSDQVDVIERQLGHTVEMMMLGEQAQHMHAEVAIRARGMTMAMAALYCAALLVQHAHWSGESRDALIASEWTREVLLHQSIMGPFDHQVEGKESVGRSNNMKRGMGYDSSTVTLSERAAVIAGVQLPLSTPRAKY